MAESTELVSNVREAAGAIAVARGGEGDASAEWQKFDDALTRLEEENRRLRDALRRIADGSDYTWGNIARLALERSGV